MTRPRRFRDMSLTESEAWEMAQQHWCTVGGSYPDGAFDVFEERCGRLLPLWRKLGLEELSGSKATIGESSLGRLEYKGPWSAWLSWFARAPLAFPADYNIVFRVTQPRKKREAQ